MVEDRNATLEVALGERDNKIDNLERKNGELSLQLAITCRESQVSFMKTGDMAAIGQKKVVDSTAMDIIEALKPFITSELSALN